ncbi:hypothetical protein Salat_1234100 [Sesamum alatum]|uniref:Uncharacterized protein n=1 Tax=Sesamum alatum TaxID=300844 RepID=A0AAE1YFZ8_9LAMI|nr:hypothetical protein Salat_1234100 [Sesamum alatum]
MDPHLLAHGVALCIVDVHGSYISYASNMPQIIIWEPGVQHSSTHTPFSNYGASVTCSRMCKLYLNATCKHLKLVALGVWFNFCRILSRTRCSIVLTAIPSACSNSRCRAMAKLSTQLKEGTEIGEVGNLVVSGTRQPPTPFLPPSPLLPTLPPPPIVGGGGDVAPAEGGNAVVWTTPASPRSRPLGDVVAQSYLAPPPPIKV